jgi:quercetin dioxygenase-like cupin family protein
VLWRLEGRENAVLTGIHLSTENLTSGVVELLPGQRSDPSSHAGELTGFVVDGRLNLCLLDPGGDSRSNRWFEAHAGDGYLVPEGAPYQYFNMTAEPVRLLFGVAPGYLPPDDQGL